MNIKGAIFDMDGTLVDSLMFWDVLWNDIGEKYLGRKNFKLDADVDRKVRTMIYSDAMILVKEYLGIDCDSEDFIKFATSRNERFYTDVAKPKVGTFEFLDHLKNKGVKLCLASASDMKDIKTAMSSCGFADYFDTSLVFSCTDIGVGKEKPDIYLKSMEALGFCAEDICLFEDSYVALETGKRLGFKTVGIYDKHNFGQKRLKTASDIYVGENETMAVLTAMINPD